MSHLFMRWVTAGGYFDAYPGLHESRKHVHDACFRRFTGSATAVTADTQRLLGMPHVHAFRVVGNGLGLDKLSEVRHAKRNGRNVAIIEIMTLHNPVYRMTVLAIGE
jgi:hypothetical protein